MELQYSKFKTNTVELGKVVSGELYTAEFQFEPVKENNPIYHSAVADCGCTTVEFDTSTNKVKIDYLGGSMSYFHKHDLGMTELPIEKKVTIFINELGSLKEHILTIKAIVQ